MNNEREQFPGMDSGLPPNAVSLYDANGGAEDFPVLKAFQQYIDAEQAKARKRLISLGIFFFILMGAVIAVFVGLLLSISQRNQALNDRLVEFAMKERDRDRQAAAVVVQPPPQQQQPDNSAILALTDRLEQMQKKLAESQKQAQEAEAAARKAAEAAKGPSPEQLEIQRLTALLTAEKEKATEKALEEKKMKRELELEAYRRKHYPEFYAPKPAVQPQPPKPAVRQPTEREVQEIFDEIDGTSEGVSTDTKPSKKSTQKKKAKAKKTVEVSEESAISYFDEKPEEKPAEKKTEAKNADKSPSLPKSPSPQPAAKKDEPYTIPVDVKGSTSQWQIPQ